MNAATPLHLLRGRVRRGALTLALLLAAAAPAVRAQQPSGPDTGGPDPRVGLKAGWRDAGEAARNLELIAHRERPEGFVNPTNPGDFAFVNADLAFRNNLVFQGGYNGFQIWDVSNPSNPTLRAKFVCPGGQGDVSVYRNLLFVSVEETRGQVNCGTGGAGGPTGTERFRGIRVFDITNLDQPKQVAAVQTCRGSHTNTLVPDPKDPGVVYIYVSGTSPVRPEGELAGCSGGTLADNPNTALFRIEVIRVPVAAPEQAKIVNSPRILAGLAPVRPHGATREDSIAAAQRVAAARAQGAFTVTIEGQEQVVPPQFAQPLLDSIAKARHGGGPPTAADSAELRTALPAIVTRMMGARNNAGSNQCHDITVYPELGLGAGACAGNGLLLDIRDPANPKRVTEVSDPNFAYWHSATFSNDGSKLLFSDEWGGGVAPRCRASDPRQWGADAVFTLDNGKLERQGYYKLPAPQTAQENCVAHNGSLIPVPGRDIMVQAWYQGGASVFDFTDPKRPFEIAFFDRGPLSATEPILGGYWSVYWYNGAIYGSEIGRGLDVFQLKPSAFLSQNEIDAARLVRMDVFNPQSQPRIVWPAAFVVARAYLDQLVRGNGVQPSVATRIRDDLARAERARAGSAVRRTTLTRLAADLERDADRTADPARVRMLVGTLRDLASARR